MGLDRRDLLKLAAASGATGALTACVGVPEEAATGAAHDRIGFAPSAPLQPLRLSADRLVRITVCTRPFRPSGPRLETEIQSDKRIIHNYGHGGAGWSLSWGCAEEAAARVRDGGAPDAVAVIGAGVIGLTTAFRLVEQGMKVTIYAAAFAAESRSARATGVWSPSSRIALAPDVTEGFADRWERWARLSFAVHQQHVGQAMHPVEYLQKFSLYDAERPPRIPASRAFLHLHRRVRDLTPPWRGFEGDEHPFNVDRVRGGQSMVFNVARYAETLSEGFLRRGGRMVRRTFPDRALLLALPEPVIVNCTGYGARDLFGDETLVPVRGQINWFPAQPEAPYGVSYRNVSAYSRRDGVIVQASGENDDHGYGDATEIPDRDEALTAIETLAPVFGGSLSQAA